MSSENDPRVEGLLAAPDARFDPDAALARFRARRPAARPVRFPIGPIRLLASAAAVVVVATALTMSGVAGSFLQIFEPRTFVAITFDPRDLTTLPDLSAYGKVTWGGKPTAHAAASLGAAATEAGFTPKQPTLPANITGAPQVTVMPQTAGTFVPSAYPSAIVRGTAGPAVIQTWTAAGSSQATSGGVVVVQGRVPTLVADGVTLDQLRTHLLAQPGFPPAVAAQLRAIADPSSTVPIPIPIGQASTKSVRVQGVDGLFIGDSTGLGAGVIWRQGDFVYAVGGTLTEAQVLSIANTLH